MTYNFCVCVRACFHVCVCACLCLSRIMHLDTRCQYQKCSSFTLCLILRMISSVNPEINNLLDQCTLEFCLSWPSLGLASCIMGVHCSYLLKTFWRFEIRSSCFHSKHFTSWAFHLPLSMSNPSCLHVRIKNTSPHLVCVVLGMECRVSYQEAGLHDTFETI